MKFELTAYGINGSEDKTIKANVVKRDAGFGVPILDIPMMSDEKWNELTKK